MNIVVREKTEFANATLEWLRAHDYEIISISSKGKYTAIHLPWSISVAILFNAYFKDRGLFLEIYNNTNWDIGIIDHEND